LRLVEAVPGVEADLGWALGAITRSYLVSAREAVADVPGGPRGYLVLAVAGRGEPRSQLALAQHLGVDRTAMTYLLDALQGAGLVERRPDPVDRRARRVALTAAGDDLLREVKSRLRHVEDALLAPLGDDDRVVLRTLLRRLATTVAPANPCEIAQEFAAEPVSGAGRTRPAPRDRPATV
jgi:DNA-binding MarR family transcriptional regulator